MRNSDSTARTKKAKKNIIVSLGLKGLSIIISFMLIPLTLGYLTPYEYGVWVTLSTMLHWIDFFDIGLGNGLRNKLSESLAIGDINKSKTYVSTTFFSLAAIISCFYLLFFLLNIWIDWYGLLNVSPGLVQNLKGIILIVSGMMCLNFVLKTITFVYYAKQVSMMSNITAVASQIFSLVVILILTKTTSGELWKVACVYSAAPVVVLGICYPLTFYVKYKELRPSLSTIDLNYLKELLGLGIEFFFLKIGGLLIFSTSNIFISNILSPEDVTTYSLSQKYFSVLSMVYSIIITPMWSAATEAYVKKDFKWLRTSCNSMLKIEGALIIGSVLMCILAVPVFKLWLRDNYIEVPYTLNICFAIYMAVFNISSCYSNYIFGMGKLRLQLISTFVSGILFVSIASICIIKFGIEGACIALIIANLPGFILNPIQFRLLLKNNINPSSIWYK